MACFYDWHHPTHQHPPIRIDHSLWTVNSCIFHHSRPIPRGFPGTPALRIFQNPHIFKNSFSIPLDSLDTTRRISPDKSGWLSLLGLCEHSILSNATRIASSQAFVVAPAVFWGINPGATAHCLSLLVPVLAAVPLLQHRDGVDRMP